MALAVARRRAAPVVGHPDIARVAIRCTDDAVDVEVTDDGRGAAAGNGEGHGIAGMRERAALLGGTLDAGPNSGRGYRVRAHLPMGSATTENGAQP